MNKIVLLLLIALVFSCQQADKKGKIASKINIETLKKIDRLPSTDSKADLSQTDDFEEAFDNYQDQFKFTSLRITSRRWVVKNDKNGKPISRERIAAITAELDGKCYIQHFIFKQLVDGSSYHDTFINEAYGWKIFDCKLLS